MCTLVELGVWLFPEAMSLCIAIPRALKLKYENHCVVMNNFKAFQAQTQAVPKIAFSLENLTYFE